MRHAKCECFNREGGFIKRQRCIQHFHGDIIPLLAFDSPLPAKCHIIMMLVILICQFAKCEMRNAICNMQNAIWEMRNAICEMPYAKTFITQFITHV